MHTWDTYINMLKFATEICNFSSVAFKFYEEREKRCEKL